MICHFHYTLERRVRGVATGYAYNAKQAGFLYQKF